MKIQLTGRHCEIHPALARFTEERLERCEKYGMEILEAHVVLTQEKFRHQAEVTLRLKQQELVATEESNEAQDAVHMAVERIGKQLHKLHDRIIRERRHGEPLRDALPAPADGAGEEA